MTLFTKDWADYDRERGTGEKTGRFAGTVAGVAGGMKAAKLVRGALGRRGFKVAPRVAGAAVAAYGAYQGAKTVGGYIGRKLDEASGSFFKDWAKWDQEHGGRNAAGVAGATVGGIAGQSGGALTGAFVGALGAVGVQAAGRRGMEKYPPPATDRRAAKVEALAANPGTAGEGAAAKAAAARLRARPGAAPSYAHQFARVLAGATAGHANMGPEALAHHGVRSFGTKAGLAVGGALGAYYGAKAGWNAFHKIKSFADLTGILDPAAPAQPRGKAGGMVQGRGRANAGPSRALMGPDLVKSGEPVAKRMGKAAARSKVASTMHEWKHGTLRSGSKHGPQVKSQRQAVAIALNQAGLSRR